MELIVVLVILAVLAAIVVPSMVGWIKKSKEKACMSELGGIQRSYLAGAALERYLVTDPEAVLDYAVQEWGGSGALSETTFSCPCGESTGTVTYGADNASILTIECAKHGRLGGQSAVANVAEGITNIWDIQGIQNSSNSNDLHSIADYFADRSKEDWATLDSEGVNWGKKITTLLSDKFNLDMSTALWRIQRTGSASPNQYEIVWTDPNFLATAQAGTQVPVTCILYDASTGAMSTPTTVNKYVGMKKDSSGNEFWALKNKP